MNPIFARRVSKVKASEIRELLKLTEQPGMISFAGGLPAPELFPKEELIGICTAILQDNCGAALQYSATEGIEPLRNQISLLMGRNGMPIHPDQILITTGSQQVLDLAGKVFLDEGDLIFCESPTYLAAISAFNVYLPRFVEIETDDDGIIPESLERSLKEIGKPKFLYVIPDFQNPSGRSMSTSRRMALMEIANREDLIILEDNPYGEVGFEAEKRPTLKSMDTDGRVIYTSTLSKTFSPGLRIGWVAAEKELLQKFVLFKQGSDLHSNTMAQMMAAEFMEKHDYQAHIDRIRSAYRSRRDAMRSALVKHLPQARITNPEGGLFFWAELPEGMNSRELMEKCLKKKVAFVPGGSFFPEKPQENTMRLNFSCMDERTIEEGVRRMGEAYLEMTEVQHRKEAHSENSEIQED